MAPQTTTEYLKELILRASSELRVEPYDLDYNAFQKWASKASPAFFAKADRVRAVGGYTTIRDAAFPRKTPEVEKVIMKGRAATNRREATALARDTIFMTSLEEVLARTVSPIKVRFPKFKSKGKKAMERIGRELHVLLSDLHFGSDVDSGHGPPLRYGKVEEARRLAYIAKQVCEYKRQYRGETRLRIHLCGDIIQGQLHDQRDGDILARQCARAIHLLIQFVAICAAEFPEVVVDCSTGNHDRFTSRHKERATYEKGDSLATVIYYAVKKAVEHLPNVKFNITLKPYITFESFGAKCFGTHGDTVLNPGYPGSVVNVKSLEQQINRINAALPNADEYKLFVLGHVHVGMLLHMGNGSILITNGALIPSDQYSISIGLFENNCGQWMWESTPGYVVGDSRFITVNGSTDKNEDLDSIIRPFESFEA
ncbi:metallo-dependent phosphatase [Myxococcus phage Mx1]|nr:metallo-dependent phosphatase [Myxococcus phage Mx1]